MVVLIDIDYIPKPGEYIVRRITAEDALKILENTKNVVIDILKKESAEYISELLDRKVSQKNHEVHYQRWGYNSLFQER